MFKNLNIQGEVTSEETKTIVKVNEDDEVISEKEVQVSKGEFNKVSVESNGDKITLKGRILEIQRTKGVQTIAAFKVEEPGKASYDVTSLESERLYNPDGSDREVPAETQVNPVLTGKAYEDEGGAGGGGVEPQPENPPEETPVSVEDRPTE